MGQAKCTRLPLISISILAAAIGTPAVAVKSQPLPPGAHRQAQPEGNAACQAIRQACRTAGFTPGAGLQRSCFEPVASGTARPRREARPLPQVAPEVVAACRNGAAGTSDIVGGASQTTKPERGVPEQAEHVSWPRGIFLYREQLTNDAQFQQALNTPGIDGMAVVLDWSVLEPTEGAFVAATIDSQITEAQQHHLPIELVIRAGTSTPPWVSPSAQLRLAYSPHGGVTGRCEPVNMPPPWDAGYQQAFAKMLQKTADYVRAKGIAIAAVKLTGVNSTTEELRLPAESPDVTAHCQGGAVDDIAAWRQAAFTPSKVTQGLDQFAAIFAKTFPDTPVTLAIIPRGGFPAINDSGEVMKGQKKAALNNSLLQSLLSGAAAAVPARFVLQFDYLMYGQPANAKVVSLARDNNLPLAWQTNLWRGAFGQGAGCGGSPGHGTECTDAQYLGLLEEGVHPVGGSALSGRGLYIEVFPYDAIAHPQIISQVHAELVGEVPPIPLPHPTPPPCPPGTRCPPPS